VHRTPLTNCQVSIWTGRLCTISDCAYVATCSKIVNLVICNIAIVAILAYTIIVLCKIRYCPTLDDRIYVVEVVMQVLLKLKT